MVGWMVRQIRISVDDEEYEELNEKKDGRTWREVLKDGAEVNA